MGLRTIEREKGGQLFRTDTRQLERASGNGARRRDHGKTRRAGILHQLLRQKRVVIIRNRAGLVLALRSRYLAEFLTGLAHAHAQRRCRQVAGADVPAQRDADGGGEGRGGAGRKGGDGLG